MKPTLKTTIKKNYILILALFILAVANVFSVYRVATLETMVYEMKNDSTKITYTDFNELKDELEDLNERHESLATHFYDLADVFDDNVKTYNDAIKELREGVATIADVVKKMLNYY